MSIGEEQNKNTQYTIDGPKRLSESILWKVQRDYFIKNGINAWNEGVIPHHVTSNPYISDVYSRLVMGLLHDWARTALELNSKEVFDENETVHIVEMGAGTGRFAFHFLKDFTEKLHSSELSNLKFKYVLTDLVEENIDFCISHESLKPFIEDSILDFATYDATNPDKKINLILSGETIDRNCIHNPLIVIANYFFDSIPQDIFYLDNGSIYEAHVKVNASDDSLELTDPGFMSKVQLIYSHVPANEPYYNDAEFNNLITGYNDRLGNSTLSFPVSALENIRYFRELSNDNLALLCADKGSHWEEDIIGWGEPQMAIHDGCFSMDLNLHTLGQYFKNAGGTIIQSSHRYNSIDIVTLALGISEKKLKETKRVFDDTVERFSPADLFNLLQSTQELYEGMGLEQLLAWLRLSKWDAVLLMHFFPTLLQSIPSAGNYLKGELNWVLKYIWSNYYDINDGQNLPFCLGTLHCALGNNQLAIEFLQMSLHKFGPDERAYYNLAICYEALNQVDTALDYARKACSSDLVQKLAKQMIVRLESCIERETMRQQY